VSNSSFLNNTAGSATGGGQANPSEGGAILNTGTLTIANSTFSATPRPAPWTRRQRRGYHQQRSAHRH